jgi:hypothetical protein
MKITLNEELKEERDLMERSSKIKLNKEQEKYRDLLERKRDLYLEGDPQRCIKHFEARDHLLYQSTVIASDYKDIAIVKYFETGDVEVFREWQRKAGQAFLIVFQRELSEPELRRDFLACKGNKYQGFLEILASGEFESAKEFAKLSEFIVPGDMSYIEPEDRRFFTKDPEWRLQEYFFKMFRALLLDYKDVDRLALAKEAEEYFARKYKAFVGYAQIFQAIELKDEALFKEAMDNVMKGFGKMWQRFYLEADSFIAFSPLGMANLGRHYGFKCDINYPRLPRELVIDAR